MERTVTARITRLLARMAPAELAAVIGVSVATIYRWKAKTPKRPLSAAVARALDAVEARLTAEQNPREQEKEKERKGSHR